MDQRRLLVASLALGVLVLALAGRLIQALRWPAKDRLAGAG
jgi:hypothetical protein